MNRRTVTRRGPRERGGISPAMAVGIILMAVMAMGAISVGRIAATRQDTQRAADSAVLTAAQLVRDRGLPFTNQARVAAEAVARRNSNLPLAFSWNIRETSTSVNIDVRTSVNLALPTLVFSGGSTEVSARAQGKVTQIRIDDAERRLPKLVLALDYSGSMRLPFSGGGSSAINVLESSVAQLLRADLMVDYGAAFYSSRVFRTVSINPNAPNQIISIMNRYGAGGVTNTADALNRSGNIVTAGTNTGRYVLLVSDGEPCCSSNSFSAARSAARGLWNRDVTIFTLEIRRRGSSSRLSQFMTDVAGSPSSRGDRNYHFVATTAADLVRKFEDIVASIVCKAGPLTPAPADPSTIHVYLNRGGTERSVPQVADLAASRAIEGYQYKASDRTIRLTSAACDAVIDSSDQIVVRFDRPGLSM